MLQPIVSRLKYVRTLSNTDQQNIYIRRLNVNILSTKIWPEMVSWSAFLIYLKIMRSHKWASPLRPGIWFKKKSIYDAQIDWMSPMSSCHVLTMCVCIVYTLLFANDTILIVVTNNSETTTDEPLQTLLAISISTPIYILWYMYNFMA